MFGKVFPSLLSTAHRLAPSIFQINSFHSLTIAAIPNVASPWSYTSIRTKIRNYFPRPSETKRIKKHGWEKRMSTPGGRRILMRRILKGHHVLSH